MLFALDASGDFGARVALALGVALAHHEERGFEDGEHKSRPLENVRGRDVFVLHSLHGDRELSVNDKLVRLLFFIGALKDASAACVTAVTPYLCYARKDRKTKPRDPVTTRYVARMLEAAGADRVLAMDVHNLAAYQNAFRIPTDHLEAKRLFVDHFAGAAPAAGIAVVSPDAGGVKRADAFRESLERRLRRPVASAFLEKRRSEGVVSGDAVVGTVADRIAIVVDDLMASGTTIVRAARACRERGALGVYGAVTHGVFGRGADEALADPALDLLVLTDTIPPFRLASPAAREKLVVLEAAPLFAEAIRRIHGGGSLVELLAD